MLATPSLRRLIYSSRAIGPDQGNAKTDILAESRRNNGIDGISGILWSHKDRYLQVLEGPSESIGQAFERIRRDTRHTDVRILEDRSTADRQFGDWAMAGMPGDHPDDAKDRLRLLLRNVDTDVARFFAE